MLESTSVVRAAAAILGLPLVLSLATAGCELQYSERSEFRRDVPLPDPGACGPVGLAWRAVSVTVEAPDGIAAFQPLLTEATDNDNLNFMVAQTDEPLIVDESPWPLQIGNADSLGGGCYTAVPEYPLAQASAEVELDGPERPFAATDLEFTVVAKLPFEVPLPLTATRVAATSDSELESLTDGRIDGVILGEVAGSTLLDLQEDGDPANDLPLTNFLGTADLDIDGDGVFDDYTAAVAFESERVGLTR